MIVRQSGLQSSSIHEYRLSWGRWFKRGRESAIFDYCRNRADGREDRGGEGGGAGAKDLVADSRLRCERQMRKEREGKKKTCGAGGDALTWRCRQRCCKLRSRKKKKAGRWPAGFLYVRERGEDPPESTPLNLLS